MYLHQCGFKNVISTLNTRITMGHLKRIIRFKRIIFCFDNDAETHAGQNAVIKHASTILSVAPKMDIYKVELPSGKDPNESSADELLECFKHLKKIKIDNDSST